MMNINRHEQLKQFLVKSAIEFDNLELLDTALTHSSFCRESGCDYITSNERLEFLGDAVLKLVISDYLYKRFASYNEGELTKIRSVVVSDEILEKLALKIGLPDYLKLGTNEEKNDGRYRGSTLACAFEALLGALYLDGKQVQLEEFLVSLLHEEITLVDEGRSMVNHKAVLQEYLQSAYGALPEYIVVNEEGPPHNKIFTVDIIFDGKKLGTGTANSKKSAQKLAAQQACEVLKLI
ncbi:MAG: ribonuclease III [Candidatus Gastranaerophilales bacterium]|nr:ribonuclease III [Candidatus Gastranaerophilales bacterium]